MKFLIAAGGTGGHVFPGVALADEIRKRDQSHRIIFIGTKLGMETTLIPKQGYPLRIIWGAKLKQGGLLRKILSGLILPVSFLQALGLMVKEWPQGVIGIGGYASGPVVLAAVVLRRFTAILEPNSVPGLSNRWLGRWVKRIYVGFPQAMRFFPRNKTLLSGNPVRAKVLRDFELSGEKKLSTFKVLILGGSQGAHQLNQVFTEALSMMTHLRSQMTIIHQTGVQDYQQVCAFYEKYQWQAKVFPFIEELGEHYAAADFVITRAGASTIAELVACRKPALLIPYPYAADDHQKSNAETLVQQGAAFALADRDVTIENLSDILLQVIHDRHILQEMSEQLKSSPGHGASQVIIDDFLWHLQGRAA